MRLIDNKLKNNLMTLAYDFLYVFINYIVAYIPIWFIRKKLYQIFGMKIGKQSRINMRCIVFSPWKIKIGENVIVNEHALLDGRGRLMIDDSTSISMYATIYTGSHYSFSKSFEYYCKPVSIGKCCWIGAHAVVMPGSLIGDRAIISVNSVFKGTAEEACVYVGNPAEKKKKRELENNYTLEFVQYFR